MARSKRASVLAALGCLVTLAACSSTAAPTAKPETGPLTLKSAAFASQGLIPINYSCAGANISPPLTWHGVAPAGTQSWAIVMRDLDVKPTPWVHWSVTDIALGTRSTTPGQAPKGSVTNQASNGTAGFVGACPPSGKTHHYEFTVFAMSKPVNLGSSVKAAEALAAIKSASVGSSTLTGRFAR
jgi:Raf kinase inhibitor-like YbhB/YbcL family protein